ncbi:MAG: DinB family protein [Gemmatales bacterium]
MSFDLEHALEVLQRTPSVLHSLLHCLSDFWCKSNYGPETFSPFDVVGHLIHGEETDWMVRAHIILEQGEAQPLPPFDRYAMYETSRGKTMADLLAEFAQLREKNLNDLRALKLTPEQLDKRGTHPALGTVTLKQLLATWVAHDLNHLHQIAKAMAYQYRNEVGPWREYLTFLPRD